MGRFWVKVIKPVIRYDLTGAYTHYMPGDWFECKNQELAELLLHGKVETSPLDIRANFEGKDAGVLVVGSSLPNTKFSEFGLETRLSKTVELPWERTVLWFGRSRLTVEAAALGLLRVDADDPDAAWAMAAMLDKKSRIARDIGSDADRETTLEALGDLRLPVYETGIIWVRRTDTTKEVIRLWQEEVAAGAEPRHAFLRTIYARRVMLCTLPANWIGQWMRG